MFIGNSITSMVATLLAVLLAITCHETAHGYVAYRLGDPTAKNQGRADLKSVGSFGSGWYVDDVDSRVWLGKTCAG